jgi:hypothetical protein
VKENEINGDGWKCVVKKSKEDLGGLESRSSATISVQAKVLYCNIINVCTIVISAAVAQSV